MNYALVNYPDVKETKIADYRKKYDPSFNTLKSHITMMVNVSGNEISESQLIEHIESIIISHNSFLVSLQSVKTSPDESNGLLVYLDVKDGKEELIKIHKEIYTNILSNYKFPYLPFNPHITLGLFSTENEMSQKALQEAHQVEFQYNYTAKNFHLIKGDGINPAIIVKEFSMK